MVDYAIQFRTLAEETGWEEEAVISTFYHGLAEEIKDELLETGAMACRRLSPWPSALTTADWSACIH